MWGHLLVDGHLEDIGLGHRFDVDGHLEDIELGHRFDFWPCHAVH